MKPCAAVSSLLFRVVVLGMLLAVAGCGQRSMRPASSLSDQDRLALDDYEQIRAALAADDVAAAKRASAKMVADFKPADEQATPSPLFQAISAVDSIPHIDVMRQHFQTLSELLVPKAQGVEGYYVMTCELPNAGDWVQRTPDVSNPYLGKARSTMGELKK